MSWNDPKVGLVGAQKFAQKTNQKESKVRSELTQNDAYVLNKPIVQNYPTRSVIVHRRDEQWQADLLDCNYYKAENDGYRYILVVVDVFSKYAWFFKLKKKEPAEVVEAFKKIFQSGRKPWKLQTDDGNEFKGSFLTLLEREGVEKFSSKSQFKASVVESLNRTLRNYLARLYTVTGKFNWTQHLEDLNHNYNHTPHATIGMTPVEASRKENEEIVLDRLRGIWNSVEKGPIRFKVGDYVRFSNIPGVFSKTDKTPKWLYEVFTVSEVLPTYPVSYRIKDSSGEEFDSIFYNQELTKSGPPNPDKPLKIDKILAREKRNGEDWIKVRYQGLGAKYDDWIPK